MLFPNIGQAYVPSRIRLVLAFMICWLVFRSIADSIPPEPPTVAEAGLIIFGEFLIGFAIGLVVRIALGSLNFAGAAIGFVIGLANAQLFNPLQAQQSLLPSIFLTLLGTVLIFATNLHHMILLALVESYRMFVPGTLPDTGALTSLVAQGLAASFRIGLQISAPFIVASIGFYILLGVMTRLAPQIQVFFVALPLQILLGFLVLLSVISAMMLVFLEYFEGRVEIFL